MRTSSSPFGYVAIGVGIGFVSLGLCVWFGRKYLRAFTDDGYRPAEVHADTREVGRREAGEVEAEAVAVIELQAIRSPLHETEASDLPLVKAGRAPVHEGDGEEDTSVCL